MATLLPPQFHVAMFKTLYKTATPQVSVHDAEFYQPMIATAVVYGKQMYMSAKHTAGLTMQKKERCRQQRRFFIKRDSNQAWKPRSCLNSRCSIGSKKALRTRSA